MSRGFVCVLIGIAITVFAWFSPWFWPGWPGVPIMAYITTRFDFLEMPYATRAAIVVAVMLLNIAWWTFASWLIARFFLRRTVQR